MDGSRVMDLFFLHGGSIDENDMRISSAGFAAFINAVLMEEGTLVAEASGQQMLAALGLSPDTPTTLDAHDAVIGGVRKG